MIKALQTVWDMVEKFTRKPVWVDIDEICIESYLSDLKKVEVKDDPLPKGAKTEDSLVTYELMASAINYCYWLGNSCVRPTERGSTQMYEILDSVFDLDVPLNRIIQNFIEKLSLERFPLMDRRAAHLRELLYPNVGLLATQIVKDSGDIEKCMEHVIRSYPGYANDIFLKRASLMFMQVARKLPMFRDQINLLPVCADYQLPKMLEYMGVLRYTKPLKDMIENDMLIPEGSLIECEIRASTILACKKLAEKSGRPINVVDYWLWLNRRNCTNKFHLTITSNY